VSRWRAAATLALIAWCVVVVALRRPAQITDDWMGWRQADTQAIARNFVEEGFTPLHPRIDWRGDGPGFVETEAQLYPTLIAATMEVTGESEWPGQLISLACTATALALIFAALARRYGEPAGFVALVALLGHHGTLAIATSIQPDSLALVLFVIGWIAFVADLEAPSRGRLALWIAATALAGLVKPTTLELGIAQCVLAALSHRLGSPRLWLGWAVVLAIVIAFLAYARTLYVTYGNTFGVLSGGDSKLPAVAMMKDSETWIGLARFGINWGVGALAIPAAIYLAWKRALEPAHYALAIAAVLLVVVALRYTSGTFGTHYHLPHIVLGGWLVAAAVAQLGRPRIVAAVVAVCALVQGGRGLHFLRSLRPEPETTLGDQLAALAPPHALVVVRARAESFNTEWHTANNFQDPRVFYLSRTKGWALPNDLAGAAGVADAARHGALFYAHVHQMPLDAALAAWLAAHATLVATSQAGQIYALSRTQ